MWQNNPQGYVGKLVVDPVYPGMFEFYDTVCLQFTSTLSCWFQEGGGECGVSLLQQCDDYISITTTVKCGRKVLWCGWFMMRTFGLCSVQ